MKNKINIHIVEFEDKDSWIKGSKEFPQLFKEAYSWMEEIEAGFENEFSEFIETEFIHYHPKDEKEMINNIKAKEGLNIYVCGSHFVSYASIKKLSEEGILKKEKTEFLQFDFHPDLRDVYEGRKLSHATMTKRIAELGLNITQIGIGEQSIEDLYNAKKHRIKQFYELPEYKEIRGVLSKDVYLSLDADAFTFFSNVSTPSLSKIDESVFKFLKNLSQDKRMVGIDIVEIIDSKTDSMKAAQLIRKILFYIFKGKDKES